MEIGTLTRLGNSVALCLPRAYLRQLGWFQGDKLAILVQDGKVVITKLEDYVISKRKGHDGRGAVGLAAITRRARFPKN